MLPKDPKVLKETIDRWTNGDPQAAAFLMEIAEIARLADNIVDEEENRQRNVAWLLIRTLVHLPANPFFIANAHLFGLLFASIIIQWQQSDEWRLSGDVNRQTFGFVMRESVGQIFTAVALLKGNFDSAKRVADEFYNVCHANSTETVEDWAKES